MPTLAFRTILESAAATAAVALLWARRAWLAAKILWVVGEAWCLARRLKTKKEKRMNGELVANTEAVAQQFGIKETTEVIDLGLALGNSVFQSLQDDGKITFGDVPKFGPALLAVAPAIEGVTQVQIHDKIQLTFARALRSFLRHDPDIILVGEIRDPGKNQTARKR